MEEIRQLIEIYNVEIIIGIAVAFLVLLVLYLISSIRISKMKKRYKELVRVKGNVNIEDVLIRNGQEIDDLKEQIKELGKSIEGLNTKLTFAIQKVGFIRYSAFGDLGSDLSFSIAFLDGFLNGFVLTSIYNRGQCICYAKPIKNGKSVYPLSVEEMQSIDRAIKGESFTE
jgi:hypothetical protein